MHGIQTSRGSGGGSLPPSFFTFFYCDAPQLPRMARVLVVDDEPAVRRALERALRLDSYDVEPRRRRRGGARRAREIAPRRGDPRHRDAQARRPRGLPADAPGRRPHPDPDAHRPRRDRRPRRGARRRRRRLPGQAVRAARAAGAAAGAAAPRRATARDGEILKLRRPRARPDRPRGPPRRPR